MEVMSTWIFIISIGYWFPTWKSSHTGADKKPNMLRRHGRGGTGPSRMKMWSRRGPWWLSSNDGYSQVVDFMCVAFLPFSYDFLQLSSTHWLAWQVRPRLHLPRLCFHSFLLSFRRIRAHTWCATDEPHRPLHQSTYDMVLAYSLPLSLPLSKCAIGIIELIWFSSFLEDYNTKNPKPMT